MIVGDEIRLAADRAPWNQALGDEDVRVDQVVDVDVIVHRAGKPDSRDEATLRHLFEHLVQHDVLAGAVDTVGTKDGGQ